MTFWKERKDGKFHDPIIDGKEFGEEGVLVIAPRPDWMRVPDESPVCPGEKLRVIDMYKIDQPCPMIDCGAPGIKEVTQAEKGIGFIACPACKQFIVFQRRNEN